MSLYPTDAAVTTCSSIVGKGSYGVVKKTLLDGQLVAVKSINKHCVNPLEVSIMATYNSRLLNRAMYVEVDEKGTYLLYQELAACDLKECIRKGFIPDNVKKVWMLDICEGLLFLRKENIIHGDIKPSNILVYDDNSVKLSDFGCSALVGSDEELRSVETCGTLNYSSPEVLSAGRMTHMGDIWSLGCLFYELMTGKKLLSVTDDDNRARSIALRSIQHWRRQNGDVIPTKSRNSSSCIPISFVLSGSGADMVHKMLRYDPANRSGLNAIMNHSWFLPESVSSRFVSVHVSCVMLGNVAKQVEEMRNYLSNRGISPPHSMVEKSVRIYSAMIAQLDEVTEARKTSYIECAIHVAQKLYRYNIKHYHPLTNIGVLCELELDFYSAAGFMIHKQSFHDTYVDLEGE